MCERNNSEHTETYLKQTFIVDLLAELQFILCLYFLEHSTI